jgi:hypothetical protein
MKSLSILACVLLLGACSSAPVVQSSWSDYGSSYSGDNSLYGPTSIDDPRMRHPAFYMDGDDSIPWLKAVPQYNNR